MEKNSGRERQEHRGDRGKLDGRTPQGLTGTWDQKKGRKSGGTVKGNGGTCR